MLKPSERDPSPSLLLAELVERAGFPDDVVTVLQGDAETVNALLAHPRVDAVSFVGSTPVARHVYETGTRHGKRVQALGGAKNHMVVLPDAAVDEAADAAVGRVRVGRRAVHGGLGGRRGRSGGDPLVKAIETRLADVVVGAGDAPDSMMGPLISREHRDRVRGYVHRATEEGARVVVDGTTAGPGEGFFLGCSLLDEVKPGMTVYDDEIFGPVLSVVRVPTLDDAIGLLNANPYGNGVAIFTLDGGAARSFERQVKVGMVGINVAIPVPVASHSFGGWKASLFGDSPIYGPEGIRFYSRPKVVTSRWPDVPSPGIDLGFPKSH